MELLKYNLLFNLILISLLLFGHLFIRIFFGIKKFTIESIFIALLSSIFIVSIVTSIIQTQGKTINIIELFGIIILFIISKGRINIIPENKTGIKLKGGIFILTFINLIFFSMAFVFFRFTNLDFCYFPTGDITFYAELSDFIFSTGQENTYNVLNTISNDYHGATPYHYFDVWLNGFIFWASSVLFTNINNFMVLCLITTSILASACFLLFNLIFENIKLPFKNIYLISFLSLFLSGILFENYFSDTVTNTVILYSNNIFSRSKLLTVLLMILISTYFALRNNYFVSILTMILLPALYITVLPCVIGGVIITLIANLKLNFFTRIDVYKILFFLTLNLFGIFLFYHFFGNNSLPVHEISGTDQFKIDLPLVLQLRRLIPFIKTPLLTFLVYFPYLIILGYLIYKKCNIFSNQNSKFILIFFLGSSIAGLSAWTMLYYVVDSLQLGHNFSSLYFNVTLLCFLFIGLNNLKNKLTYSIKLFLIFFMSLSLIQTLLPISFGQNYISNVSDYLQKDNCSSHHSKDYIAYIKKELNDNHKTGAYLLDKSRFYDVYSKNLIGNRVAYYLQYIGNHFGVISISDFNIPISDDNNMELNKIAFEKENELNLLVKSNFYRYVQNQKKNNTFSSIENAQLSYILGIKNISFIIKSKDAALPKNFNQYIDKIIIDSKSKESFILLKQ